MIWWRIRSALADCCCFHLPITNSQENYILWLSCLSRKKILCHGLLNRIFDSGNDVVCKILCGAWRISRQCYPILCTIYDMESFKGIHNIFCMSTTLRWFILSITKVQFSRIMSFWLLWSSVDLLLLVLQGFVIIS